MRVTDSFRSRTIIEQLNIGRERLTGIQEKLATGKRINRPSDDPLGAAQSLKLRSLLESNIQFQDNISDTISFLSITESALDDVHRILLDAKDLTLRGANDATTDRGDLAANIDLVIDNLLEAANTKFQGKYIFGGTKTLTKPYQI